MIYWEDGTTGEIKGEETTANLSEELNMDFYGQLEEIKNYQKLSIYNIEIINDYVENHEDLWKASNIFP